MILYDIHIGKEGSHATLMCGLRILGLMFAVDLALPFCTSYGLQTKNT